MAGSAPLRAPNVSRRYAMTDAAESLAAQPTPRRFVFATTKSDALALEAILKPTDRGWRSLLGYAFALPPLVVVSWLTRDAEWPVWFVAFGLVGLVAWQGARFALRAERVRAAQRHPVGAGQLELSKASLRGTIGGIAIDIPAAVGTRIETDASHLYILADDRPALIMPLSAFSGRADMAAFAAAFGATGGYSRSMSGTD